MRYRVPRMASPDGATAAEDASPASSPCPKALAEEHAEVQKKTFGKWINSLLQQQQTGDAPAAPAPVVTDLFHDLRDGLLLLAVLERLTGRRLRRERGSLRVHRLSNVAAALAVLREERVRLVNVNNVDVVDGNAKITLALVWAIILHWQFDKVLAGAASSPSALERCLLAWCRQWTRSYRGAGVDVRDFSSSWADGLALAALVSAHRPDCLDFGAVSAPEVGPARRLEAAMAATEANLGVPRLLDPEDLAACCSGTGGDKPRRRPDKKSVMTYLMCLFQALPHDDIDMSALDDLAKDEGESEAATAVNNSSPSYIGSPLKTPIRQLKKKKKAKRDSPSKGDEDEDEAGLSYSQFCSVHEDVLEWLLDVEDRLAAMPEVGGAAATTTTGLSSARAMYQDNREFLSQVEAQDRAVGEVRD